MSAKIVGIDIGHDCVSAVVIGMGFQKIQLNAHSSVAYSTKDDMPTGLTDCLNRLAEQTDISGMPSAISFSSDDLFYRNLSTPFHRRHEIEKILPCELEPLLPLPVDELITDFQIVETQSGKSTLLSASVSRMFIDTIRAACEPHRLNIRRFMPGISAIALCHSHLSGPAATSLMLDMDKHFLSCCIISGLRIYLIRKLTLNANTPSFMDEAWLEIQRTLLMAEQTFGRAFSLDGIYINGDTNEPGSTFCSSLSHILGIPVHPVDLLDNRNWVLNISPMSNQTTPAMNRALASAVVMGKAVSGINFRDKTGFYWNIWHDYRSRWIELGVYAAIALILAITTVSIDMVYRKKQLRSLDQQVSRMFYSVFPNDTPLVDPIHQVRLKMQETAKNEWLQHDSQHGLLYILKRISENTPTRLNVTIRRLTFDENRIQVIGFTPDFETVYEFKRRLEDSETFESTTLLSSTQNKSEDRINFSMELKARMADKN
ncbi:MAG: PilN domain-containing protein [Desulfatirhabdiaceae bacterium]